MSSTLSRNTLYSGLDSLVLVTLAFVNIGLLNSTFGISGFGVYSFLMMFSVYGSLVAFDFGIEGVLIYRIAKTSASNDDYQRARVGFAGLILLSLLGIMVGFAVYLILTNISSSIWEGDSDSTQKLTASLFWVALAVPFQFLSLAGNGILLGLNKFGLGKGISVFFLVFNFCVILICCFSSQPFSMIFKLFFLGAVLRALVSAAAGSFFVAKDVKVDRKLIAELTGLVRVGGVLFISRIVGFVFNYTDKIIISTFLGSAALGAYEIVRRLSGPAQLINTVLISALLPEITRKLENRIDITQLMHTLTKVIMVVVTMGVAFSYSFADDFIVVWLGEDVTGGVESLLFIPLLWIVMNVLPSIYNTIAIPLNKVNVTLVYGILGAIVNLTFSLILVQKMGIKGVLVGTFIAHFVIFLCYLNLVRSVSFSSINNILIMYLKVFFLLVSILMVVKFVTEIVFYVQNIVFLGVLTALVVLIMAAIFYYRDWAGIVSFLKGAN
jgi:O-antigen/teichoic acid export membrane protein